MKMQIEEIESHRGFWSTLAKKNGWYAEPFGIQVWVDETTGQVTDSLSWRGLTEDIVIRQSSSSVDDE